MLRKTKIVATIGPATWEVETIKKLITAGVNVARINFSHGDHDTHARTVDRIKQAREAMDAPLAIMLDTKGPEIRIKTFAEGEVELVKGQKFVLTAEEVEGDENRVSVTYAGLAGDLQIGSRVLIDDGLLELRVTNIEENGDIECIALNGAVLGNNKGINLPEANVSLPSLTPQDIEDIKFGIKHDLDFVAASFVRSAKDVLEIRQVLEDNGGSHILIIAKIENREGVNNLKSILEVSDSIMVARGDMGVEIPPEEVPLIQKYMIKEANKVGKPVITATQMLESMVTNPRPTRAEANDVANAIFDGTDAIMLSGETAKGAYPVESVQMMDRIAREIEDSVDYGKSLKQWSGGHVVNITNAITHAATNIAQELGAACVATVTKSGFTARMVAKFRPARPAIAVATSEHLWRQMSLLWGIVSARSNMAHNENELFELAAGEAMKMGLAKNGDAIVIVAGVPVGVSGSTNLIKVHVLGNVLTRGRGVGTGVVVGKSVIFRSSEGHDKKFVEGDILVTTTTDDSLMDYIRKAGAVVVGNEQQTDHSHAQIACKALKKPLIITNEMVTDIIHNNITITVDADAGFVYNGVVSN
ncbi:MAG: pyruvate kinase [Defluviitaleaceae bacterium]|nr:pyruvate kinase [Defluviitaleaceae bacterium]